MKEKADAWQMDIATLSWEFEQELTDLNESQLNWKPDKNSWSIAEILAHLIRLNATYFPVFDQIIQGKYKSPLIGKISFMVNATGNFLIKAMKNPRKTKTFPIWQPDESDYEVSIIHEFFEHQHLLSTYIQKLEPFFDQKIVISSPANKWIVYYLDQAVTILIVHEQRHLDQMKAVVSSLKSNIV